MNRKNIALGGALLSLLLFFQNQGWIDLTNIVKPEPVPAPVVVPDKPEPTPVVPTPNVPVVDPNKEILLAIEEEGFPPLPSNLSEASLPIKENLLACKDANKALLLARVYADWATVLPKPWTQAQLKTYGQFQQDHYDAIKGMLEKHNLTVLCTGVGVKIDDVIKASVGEHNSSDIIPPEDFEKLGLAFQAISARGYESFKELIK